MAEYAILLTLVAIFVIVVILTMGNNIRSVFSNVACSLSTGADCTPSAVSPAPTICPTLQTPTLPPEVTSVPVYTFTSSDFSSHHQVLQGSIIRLLFSCPQSQASYSSVSTPTLVPILSGNGYAVFVASSPGDASISGPLDHSANSPLWHIDVTVTAP
jgi:Flp pilus assembly pilin Flp